MEELEQVLNRFKRKLEEVRELASRVASLHPVLEMTEETLDLTAGYVEQEPHTRKLWDDVTECIDYCIDDVDAELKPYEPKEPQKKEWKPMPKHLDPIEEDLGKPKRWVRITGEFDDTGIEIELCVVIDEFCEVLDIVYGGHDWVDGRDINGILAWFEKKSSDLEYRITKGI